MPAFQKETSSTEEEILRTMMTSFELEKKKFTGKDDVRIRIDRIREISEQVVDDFVIVPK